MLHKLNLGCGSVQPEGWVNVDKEVFGQEYQFELTPDIAFNANHFDVIVAHCSIQMNEFKAIPTLLETLFKILKPGGAIRISLPDIIRGFEAYKAKDIDWFPNGEENLHLRFSAWLTWYSTTKTLLTQKALVNLLTDAGFVDIISVDFKQTYQDTKEIIELDTRDGEVYFMEARKPK
jgi:predicted SAM-dependent methyltransferase